MRSLYQSLEEVCVKDMLEGDNMYIVHVLSVLDKSEGREESLFLGAARDTRLQHDEILVQHGHNDEGKGDFI